MHGDKMTSHVTDRSPSATIVPAAHGREVGGVGVDCARACIGNTPR